MGTWTQTERLYQHFTSDMKPTRSPGYSRTIGNRRATIHPQGRGWALETFIGRTSVTVPGQEDMTTREEAEIVANTFLSGGEYFEF